MLSTNTKSKSALIFNGSPRANGNTAILVRWLKDELQQKDWQIKQFDLFRLNYKGCYHCDCCKNVKDTHGCVINDDLRPILDETVAADLIVIASPVYCWSFSGCMNAMFDRWYCMYKENNSLLKGKRIIGAFTAGGDFFEGMELCVASLKNICAYGGAIYVGTIPAANCTTQEELSGREFLRADVKNLIISIDK